MPQKPRRRLTRRNAPPRPTYTGAPGAEAGTAAAGAGSGTSTRTSTASRASAASSSRRIPEASRPAAYVERQTPYLRSEMRRVGVVTAVCFGMLAALAVVDRLQ